MEDRRDDPRGVRVKIGSTPYRTEMMAKGHKLIADEPVEFGGGNTGPSPYDYLLSALGACTAMTLRMYADRSHWELDEVEVTLNHNRIHAKDCEECDQKKGRVDVIERRIKITGHLTQDQRERLIKVADKCPVHKTLSAETIIKTTEL